MLKVSKVNPLQKKGSNLDPSNYCPVSLLSVSSKIYEKVMYARLYKFLENSLLFYSKQFGFRSNHSVNHALTSITETIKNLVDNGKFGCNIFLDLQKAFDTVSHDILLDKLEYCGVRGVALKGFGSQLSDRKQFMSVNSVSSDTLDVECGVPQDLYCFSFLSMIFPQSLKSLDFICLQMLPTFTLMQKIREN